MLTLTEAARVAHKSKAALLEAIRNGRLSAKRGEAGQWAIDPAELFRVYPQNQVQNRDLPPVGTGSETTGDDRFQNAISRLEIELQNQARTAERERKLLETTIDDLRQDRDHWRQQATHLLTYQPRPVPPRPARAGFWWALVVAAGIAAGVAAWQFWPL